MTSLRCRNGRRYHCSSQRMKRVARTFGNTAQEVIKFAGPYLQTLQSDGVVGCIKHYPGLGDAVPDAHATLPAVKRTREQIYSVELAPFKYFIQTQNKLEQPGMIMPTDADQMIQMLNGLKAALQNGTLSKARVDQAATRIIALKMQYHLMPAVAPQ